MIVASWQKCIYCLKNELPAQQFNTWIRPLRVLAEKTAGRDVMHLLAPNKFVLEWVRDNYQARIEELLAEVSLQEPPRLHLDTVTAERYKSELSLEQALSTADLSSLPPEEAEEAGESVKSSGAMDPGEVTAKDGLLTANRGHLSARTLAASQLSARGGLDNSYSSSSHAAHHNSHHDTPRLSRLSRDSNSSGRESSSKSRKIDGRLHYKGDLNKNYTFNNFIEGKSNQLARAAAAQVADNPGGAYNPLFIYGGVGLGKTHLMHSIGNHMLEQNPDANVVYLHSQTFVGSMVSALQLNAINEFKRYYHSVDALLIDDIQFFANKERSQEEFFHTFNAIFEGGRQIIMTCDKYHSEINGLEERLKSRFGWGLSVAVEPPELETRAAILINKANQENVYLPNDEAMFMAQKLRSNVRELEGALKKVIAHARFTGAEISIPLIKEALKDLLAIQNKLISVDNIQRTVAEYYKIKMADMISKRRNRSIARPRQMAMCLSKELTNHSLPEIGTMYGDRDHTTVLHACRTINELRKSSSDIHEDYQNLLRSLSS